MIKSCFILLTAFSLFQCIVQELTSIPSCGNDPVSGRTLRVSVNSRRNKSGDWVDTFTARTESGNSSDGMDLDLTHSVFECEGNYDDPHNSVVFTNRPLRNNEIFEVRLDKKNNRFKHSFGIGIITRTPDDVDILPEMYKSPVSRILHHGAIYSNSVEVVKNYGKDICELQVGDRVGVMRSEFGTLHFFVNGVDQGPAESNIPSPVYGLFELWYDAMKATILDSTSPPSS